MVKATILITGASSGIGAALAEEYARRGWNLLLVARRADKLEAVRKKCEGLNPGGRSETWMGDVTEANFAEKLRQRLESVEQLKVVFVNAGIGSAGRFDKLSLEDFRRVLETNLFGAIQTIQGSLPALKKSKGRLAILGSMNSYLALPLGAPYNISKFAVRALGESLFAELASVQVGVTMICPGPVRTEILAKDNLGRERPEAKKYFDSKPALDANVAARRIYRGVQLGRREFTLDFPSRFLIGFSRHFPGLTAFLVRFFYVRFEALFSSLVGKVNPDSV